MFDFLSEDFFLFLFFIILSIFIVASIAAFLKNKKPKPICYVYDDERVLAYEVYQLQNGHFAVMGYNGYAHQANFKSYVEVEIYIRTNLYGFK